MHLMRRRKAREMGMYKTLGFALLAAVFNGLFMSTSSSSSWILDDLQTTSQQEEEEEDDDLEVSSSSLSSWKGSNNDHSSSSSNKRRRSVEHELKRKMMMLKDLYAVLAFALLFRHGRRWWRPFLGVAAVMQFGVRRGYHRIGPGVEDEDDMDHVEPVSRKLEAEEDEEVNAENKENDPKSNTQKTLPPTLPDVLDQESFGECMRWLTFEDLARVSCCSRRMKESSLRCILDVGEASGLGLHRAEFAWLEADAGDLKFVVMLLRARNSLGGYRWEDGRFIVCEDGYLRSTIIRSGNVGTRLRAIDYYQPMHVPNRVDIVHIACGRHHCAIVSRDGRLYTWGSSTHGALGHGDLNDARARPTRVCGALQNRQVVNAACGLAHTGAVTSCGELYTFGSGHRGVLGNCRCRLGFPSRTNIWREAGHQSHCDSGVPRIVDLKKSVLFVEVDCGTMHTVALSNNGEVYSWGNAEDGRLGHATGLDEFWNCAYSPGLITELSKHRVVKVCCGGMFSAVLTSQGTVHISMLRADSMIHIQSPSENGTGSAKVPSMQQVRFPLSNLDCDEFIVNIACGADCVYGISKRGRVYRAKYSSTPTFSTLVNDKEIKVDQVIPGTRDGNVLIRSRRGSFYSL